MKARKTRLMPARRSALPQAARAAALAPSPLALLLALAFAGHLPLQAQTLPSGFSLIAGQVTEQTVGSLMTLSQTTPRAIVNWTDFAIGPTEMVNILQPGVDSVMLNRVLPGSKPSYIEGMLNANGRVFLLNPEGVVFTAGAQVSVGGLVATTLDISDSDFMAGNYRFSGLSNGLVANSGSLTASQGGTIALLGSQVENHGSVAADGGTVGLIGTQRVTLDFHGDGLTNFILDPMTLPALARVENTAQIRADGGRIAVLAHAGTAGEQVLNLGGVLRARTLAQRQGEIVLSASGNDTQLALSGVLDVSAPLAGTDGGRVAVSAHHMAVAGGGVQAAGARRGGEIRFQAEDIVMEGRPTPGVTLDASGGTQGGIITLQAGNILAAAADVALHADATGASGSGGTIRALAGVTLYARGQMTARAGAAGGDGGLVETSSAAVSVDGLRVNASAPGGRPGTWLIDPYNIAIQPGSATGVPLPSPLVPLAGTTLQDGDISAALNSGTQVTITTGDPASGNFSDGDIVLNSGVHIRYDQPMGALALQLQAHRSVRSDSNVLIESDGAGGPLHVVFQADVNGAGAASGGGQVSYSGNLYTNGGRVEMSGAWANASLRGCSVCLDGQEIDTRVGRSDAGAGGDILLTGHSQLEDTGSAGVYIEEVELQTATGSIRVDGRASQGSGVWMAGDTVLRTTGGVLDIQGVGGASADASAPGHGVLTTGLVTLSTTTGDLRLRGRAEAGGAAQGHGVWLSDFTQVQSDSGQIEVTGHAAGAAAGLVAEAGSLIEGGAGVLLRAGNDATVDAIDLKGKVRAGQWLNLRPGQVDVTGAAADDAASPIRVGGAGGAGFSVSGAEVTLLDAPELIMGSDRHAADIVVEGPVSRSGHLSLQNAASADIALQGALTADRLTLAAGRHIRQAASGAGLQAQTLVLRAGGDVLLEDGAANAVAQLAGMAGGQLSFFNSAPLTVVQATGVGIDAAAQALQLLPVDGVRGGQLRIVAGAGDLTLQAPVQASGDADLVAARNFRNDAGASVQAGGVWRIWSDRWVGEARGGLSGSGSYPNLYGRSFAGTAGVPLPNTGNTFIYVQQPEAVATVGDAARAYGLPDPVFSFSLTGLILGDSGRGIGGVLYSTASPHSPAGSYAIQGSLQSVEGYRVRVVPGVLRVTDYRLPAPPETVRDMPQTYTYDRNIALAPMCFATGPLTDPQAGEKEGDVLAREWARVRSRPQLSNCVATDEGNGCASF